jgi:hypothetical protein
MMNRLKKRLFGAEGGLPDFRGADCFVAMADKP